MNKLESFTNSQKQGGKGGEYTPETRKSMVVVKRHGGKNSKLLDPIDSVNNNKKQKMVMT